MAERAYSAGTRAALFAFCGGTCYWPGCREPVLRLVDGEYVIALQICHIYGLRAGSARHDPSMTVEQLNAFRNLIFLCHPHHVVVDRTQADRFPVPELEKWKRQREAGGQAQLGGLGNVTEATLQKFISDVFSQQAERVDATMRRLETNDAEAAVLLRELRDEVKLLRRSAPAVDFDAASMLSRAADRLVSLEDNASRLSSAARQVAGLEDIIGRLEELAHDIGRLRGMM